MKKRDSAATADAASSNISLHTNQTLAVSLPRNTRLSVTGGAVRLTYAEPTLDWLGDAAPLRTVKLHEGDTFVVERSQYMSMTGASSNHTSIHIEVTATTPVIKRLYRWLSRFSDAGAEHRGEPRERGRHA
jgi:hypothetical protein